jgi:hypothetical protein
MTLFSLAQTLLLLVVPRSPSMSFLSSLVRKGEAIKEEVKD